MFAVYVEKNIGSSNMIEYDWVYAQSTIIVRKSVNSCNIKAILLRNV